jgi:hypothetical protein
VRTVRPGVGQDETNANFKYIISLIAIGFAVSINRVYFTQSEDMGLFQTVSALVSNGYRLYEEAYEIKDPLFFYYASGFFSIFGPRGFFLIDILWITLAAPIAYIFGIRYKFPKFISFFCAIVFLLTLTGLYYQPFRTQIAAIVLVLVMMIAAAEKKWLLAGVVGALILGFKMPFGIFLILPLMVLARFKGPLIHFVRFVLGFTTTTLGLLSFMHIRGEFFPYIEMIRENFNYEDTYPEILGRKTGIIGHLEQWNSFNNMFLTYLVLQVFLFSWASRMKRNQHFAELVLLYVGNILTGIYAALTTNWVHHLQIFSLFALFTTLILCTALQQEFENLPGKTAPKLRDRQHFQPGAAIISITLIVLITSIGAKVSLTPSMNLNQWFSPTWIKPTEIALLESVKVEPGVEKSFTRLGANEDNGYGMFLDPSWRFKCARTMIYGGETRYAAKKFIGCLDTLPNFVIISPMFTQNNSRKGIYQELYSTSMRILREKFLCTSNDWSSSYNVCERINK